MIKHIATPQVLLNEKARLDFADVTGMSSELLAQHEADILVNDLELAKYGDHPMTAEEIADRQAEEVLSIIEITKQSKLAARQASLAAKWPDAFAWIDDVAIRGEAACIADRIAIKAANPKE